MNYSPIHNDLFTSFNKIGSEIDDIFNNLDVFNQSSERYQTSERYLKGGSSVDFLGPKETEPDNFPKHKLSFSHSEALDHDFSIIPLPKQAFSESASNFLIQAQSSVVELSKCGSSTPLKTKPFNQNNLNNISLSSLHSSSHTNLGSVLLKSPDSVSKEKELCKKHQGEIKELRQRILGLTDRIQVTVDERNKVFFRLEAAVREVASQGTKKEALSQKVEDLNQKMLENDYEINQLRTQISLLDGQIDTTHTSELKLLDKLDLTYSQLGHFKEERDKVLKVAQRSNDECQNVVQKYKLLQKIHDHCSTVKDNDQAERQTLFGKVDELTRVISNMQRERNDLIQNLEKVHKLVDKLERKATDKIQVLCRELKDLQASNSSLRSSAQEKDAVLSMDRATIRDLESKLIECERETADVKRFVQNHQQNQQGAISAKNKKIKILSLKVKQLQTRMQTQISQISILTETNEKLEDNFKDEKLRCKSVVDETSSKDKRIEELEVALKEQSVELKEGAENQKLQSELEASITELVQQRESIQTALNVLEQSNSARLQEIDELKHSLASTELEKEAVLHELYPKLTTKDRKIGKLKEGINQLVSSRQETVAELQELRFAVSVLQGEVHSVKEESEDKQRDLTADLKEKSVQLEQYKDLLDRMEVDQRSRVMEMESEYDFVSAAVRVRELEAENNHLKAALQKSREKHSRLKQDFGRKVREQNEIIDSCVEKEAAEKQLTEMQAYYQARVKELETSLK